MNYWISIAVFRILDVQRILWGSLKRAKIISVCVTWWVQMHLNSTVNSQFLFERLPLSLASKCLTQPKIKLVPLLGSRWQSRWGWILILLALYCHTADWGLDHKSREDVSQKLLRSCITLIRVGLAWDKSLSLWQGERERRVIAALKGG